MRKNKLIKDKEYEKKPHSFAYDLIHYANDNYKIARNTAIV